MCTGSRLAQKSTRIDYEQKCSLFNHNFKNMQSISEMFAARLEELRRIDEESNRRTQNLLNRTRALIKEIEEIDLETEY